MTNVIDWLRTNKIKFRISADQYEIGCPFDDCPNSGEAQFYINKFNGAYFCHRCNKKGKSLKQLEYALGMVSLQDPIKSTHVYINPKELAELKQGLAENEEAMDYLINKRGLSEGVVRQFHLGYRVHEGSPAIFLPSIDQHNTCVGGEWDFFTRPAGQPKYKTMKNSKSQVFNLNFLDLSQPVILTEGRYDAMALFQYGFQNVGSMPNGANSVNGWVEDVLDAPKFILCMDNDQAGQTAALTLSERLGAAKCFRVYPRVNDMNEAAQCAIPKAEVKKWFADEQPMFKPPVSDIMTYTDKAVEFLEDPVAQHGLSTGWESVDNVLGGIREREVTVLSGATGNGKTTWGVALIGNLIRLHNMKCLIISPEMKEEKLLVELANNQYRRQVDKEALIDFAQKNQGNVHLANVYGTWTKQKEQNLMTFLFDMIEYSVRHYGIKFVFIDHLRLFISSAQENERADIDAFMKKCVRAAMINNIHIMTVVQPRKLPAGQRKVTSGDLKGSVNIEQDCSNILLMHREEGSAIVEFGLEKNRELGTVGEWRLEFDRGSMANYYEVKETKKKK